MVYVPVQFIEYIVRCWNKHKAGEYIVWLDNSSWLDHSISLSPVLLIYLLEIQIDAFECTSIKIMNKYEYKFLYLHS